MKESRWGKGGRRLSGHRRARRRLKEGQTVTPCRVVLKVPHSGNGPGSFQRRAHTPCVSGRCGPTVQLLTSVPELLELAVCDALLVSEEEAEVELEALCRRQEDKQSGGTQRCKQRVIGRVHGANSHRSVSECTCGDSCYQALN